MANITIKAGDVTATAELNDSSTARMILAALPIEASGQTWGDEIYFEIPVSAEEDNAQAVVELGDLGYWPPGSAFCSFYGKTPASPGDEIRPASPVNVVGRITSDPLAFRGMRSGVKVTITAD